MREGIELKLQQLQERHRALQDDTKASIQVSMRLHVAFKALTVKVCGTPTRRLLCGAVWGWRIMTAASAVATSATSASARAAPVRRKKGCAASSGLAVRRCAASTGSMTASLSLSCPAIFRRPFVTAWLPEPFSQPQPRLRHSSYFPTRITAITVSV